MSDKVRRNDGWECPHELRTVAMPGLATPADVLAQANARAEQAEADNAALRNVLEDMYDLARLLDDDDPYYGERRNATERLAKALTVIDQPHPGSRLMELKRTVEGLPKYESVRTWAGFTNDVKVYGLLLNGKEATIEQYRELADALARLLKYRQEMK